MMPPSSLRTTTVAERGRPVGFCSGQLEMARGLAGLFCSLAGSPGCEKPLTASVAVPTLSVYWERLEAEAASAAGGAPAGGGPSLEYHLAEGGDAGGAGGEAGVVVELWAGRPMRAVASGAGPGRKEATQRAALAALRQEGFTVCEEGAGGAAAAGVKRKSEEESSSQAAAKRANLLAADM